jgi:hypothetical protein
LDATLRPHDRRGKKYVVPSTLDRVDWNAELVRGDLGKAVQQLKWESGQGQPSRPNLPAHGFAARPSATASFRWLASHESNVTAPK